MCFYAFSNKQFRALERVIGHILLQAEGGKQKEEKCLRNRMWERDNGRIVGPGSSNILLTCSKLQIISKEMWLWIKIALQPVLWPVDFYEFEWQQYIYRLIRYSQRLLHLIPGIKHIDFRTKNKDKYIIQRSS